MFHLHTRSVSASESICLRICFKGFYSCPCFDKKNMKKMCQVLGMRTDLGEGSKSNAWHRRFHQASLHVAVEVVLALASSSSGGVRISCHMGLPTCLLCRRRTADMSRGLSMGATMMIRLKFDGDGRGKAQRWTWLMLEPVQVPCSSTHACHVV